MSTDSVLESSSSGTPTPPLSKLATVHFKPEDFTRPFHSNLKRALREDELGVCIWPTIHVGKRAGEMSIKVPQQNDKREWQVIFY